MDEFKQLLKGRWQYNLSKDELVCKNNRDIYYIFQNKDNVAFQKILSLLAKRGVPNPDLTTDFLEKPTAQISLEQFHRIFYSCEFIYEPYASLKETENGLFCFSEHIKDFELNHEKYSDNITVHVDPQRICKITRTIHDRKRVITKIKLTTQRIILECEFPWTILTICIPTINKGDD